MKSQRKHFYTTKTGNDEWKCRFRKWTCLYLFFYSLPCCSKMGRCLKNPFPLEFCQAVSSDLPKWVDSTLWVRKYGWKCFFFPVYMTAPHRTHPLSVCPFCILPPGDPILISRISAPCSCSVSHVRQNSCTTVSVICHGLSSSSLIYPIQPVTPLH